MKLFQSRKERVISFIRGCLPALLLLLVVLAFVLAIQEASDTSLSSQQSTLERALSAGAIRTYALTGCYPESLDELLDTYHITYDRKKYIVEYIPQGANLIPSIFVIPVGGQQEAHLPQRRSQ